MSPLQIRAYIARKTKEGGALFALPFVGTYTLFYESFEGRGKLFQKFPAKKRGAGLPVRAAPHSVADRERAFLLSAFLSLTNPFKRAMIEVSLHFGHRKEIGL